MEIRRLSAEVEKMEIEIAKLNAQKEKELTMLKSELKQKVRNTL